jgi:hypothetical protein
MLAHYEKVRESHSEQFAPLLARLLKVAVGIVVRQISLCEQYQLPLTVDTAVSYLSCNVQLLTQQRLYLPATHVDLAATLSDIGDAIVSLKQQFPSALGEYFDGEIWGEIVSPFSSASIKSDMTATTTSASVDTAPFITIVPSSSISTTPVPSSAPTVSALQCAKLCTVRSKQLKSTYSTAVRCPLALRLLSAPPGAFCWGGWAAPASEGGSDSATAAGAVGGGLLGGLGEQVAVDEDELDFF